MVQLIAGASGQGKPHYLIDQANTVVKTCDGTVCYVDKSNKHLHDLNIKVRLIDTSMFPVKGAKGYLGFLSGLIAQDRDLQYIFCDSFLKVAQVADEELEEILNDIDKLADKYNVTVVVGISKSAEELPESAKKNVVSL